MFIHTYILQPPQQKRKEEKKKKKKKIKNQQQQQQNPQNKQHIHVSAISVIHFFEKYNFTDIFQKYIFTQPSSKQTKKEHTYVIGAFLVFYKHPSSCKTKQLTQSYIPMCQQLLQFSPLRYNFTHIPTSTRKGRKEMLYLTMHSILFMVIRCRIYGKRTLK